MISFSSIPAPYSNSIDRPNLANSRTESIKSTTLLLSLRNKNEETLIPFKHTYLGAYPLSATY